MEYKVICNDKYLPELEKLRFSSAEKAQEYADRLNRSASNKGRGLQNIGLYSPYSYSIKPLRS